VGRIGSAEIKLGGDAGNVGTQPHDIPGDASPSVGICDVRFSPKSDHSLRRSEVRLCAISDRSALQQSGLFDHSVGENCI